MAVVISRLRMSWANLNTSPVPVAATSFTTVPNGTASALLFLNAISVFRSAVTAGCFVPVVGS